VETVGQPDKAEQFLHKGDPFGCHVITVQVMAIADMSPAHQHAVSPALQCSQNKMGRNAGRAHHAHRPHIDRVGQPVDAGQVGCPIGAPVA
jgi:hypothetical protein